VSYQLSATKLQTYNQCPQAFYFRYDRKLPSSGLFGSPALGTALHQALATLYGQWHYQPSQMPWDWVLVCWQPYATRLTPEQWQSGQEILQAYYADYIAPQVPLRRPLAVEGRIQGHLNCHNLQFVLTGRYDRLDWLEDGLELIDYKSGQEVKLLSAEEIDLQIGLYYLALEQRYQKALKQLSLLYLRTGQKITFVATAEHKQRVEAKITDLAEQLLFDQQWQPTPGQHCQRCSYARYCPEVTATPDPLPTDATGSDWAGRSLQLTLNFGDSKR
jgi:putative RecB family exonuclease